jgi:hypothetical protein
MIEITTGTSARSAGAGVFSLLGRSRFLSTNMSGADRKARAAVFLTQCETNRTGTTVAFASGL